MNLSRFIERPVLSTVVSILIVILGVIGLMSLPVLQYPDIAPPTISVSTTYTGANAQTVLNSVIIPLEEQINGVENMDYMSSSATSTGAARITITFKQGTDPDMAAVNVQNRVAMAQGLLPAEVTRIGVITQKRQNSMLVVFSVVDTKDKYTREFLENYAQINIVPQVKRVNGVGDAMLMGGSYSMRLWLDPAKMAQYHLMPGDITGILATQNIEAAPGTIGERENQTFQYTLTWKGRLSTETEFEDMVIKALPDGELLRLRDVATVELGRESYAWGSWTNGHNAVSCIVYQLAGTNATTTVQNIESFFDEARTTMPDGIDIVDINNANDFLFASIHEVVKTLIEAFLLVFIVVYIFLQDMRSTLIPAIAIPVSLIGAFFALNLMGFSINLLTLNALVLAIAIVVDDAIIVVEGVHAKLDQGYKSAKKASIDAMSELGGAILSITLVMMAVFIPVSFIGGTSGIFYRQFGLTMAVAIAFSALNALTLSPALCAIFLKPHDEEAEGKKTTFVGRFHKWFNRFFEQQLNKYKSAVVRVTRKPVLTIAAVVVGIVGLFVLMKRTPQALIPNEDTGFIIGAITLPPGTSQDRTDYVLSQVDSIVAASPAVAVRGVVSGFGVTGGQGPSYGTMFVKLKPWEERSMKEGAQVVSINFLLRCREVIKDAQVLFFQPPMVPGFGATNGFTFSMQDRTGGDLNKFFEITQEFISRLLERPEIQQAQTTFNPSFPQYLIDIDVAQCMKAGLTPSDILTTLQGYYGGLYSSNFNRFGKLYRVMIQADPSQRINTESLKKVMVRNGSEMAPITQFMSLQRIYGPDNINRFNLFTSIDVNGTPADGYTSGEAMQAIKETAEKYLPQGYSYEYSGLTRDEARSSDTTGLIFVLCIMFIYLLLSAQYESYILPLAVILSVPFGLAGSFIFIQMMGGINNIIPIFGTAQNNIYTQIALIMLIGLLAKNAILIVEFALERRKMGMSITWAAVLGAGARLRPILMTSFAMIIGLLPMMFAFGVGGNGNRSLGTTAVGGMLIGMICQLFIVPSLFVIFEALQEKVKPMVWEDIDNTDADADIEQYTRK
ncbi:MAG: efflux RND transporter permease subunit [Alloprevotella sp.]|nr:efflux RND transporter permease subunit [Alloprevotella sp.]